MKQVAFWMTLELSCRLLGVSTGTVLIGVGAQTLLQGQFKSLAVYLLFSGAAILVYEAAYFASLLLAACSVLPVGFTRHPCWKEVSRCRPFQKFLAYVLLSVACFLHPVLVWHVTIPGTMLVLSGLAYFLLSKKHKETAANGPLGQYSDSCRASTAEASPDDTEQTYTFLGGSRRGQRGSLLSYARSILTGLQSQEGAVNSPDILMARRQRMSFPRPTPIYAWGEKPRPRRVVEEEHRRPPAEEEMVPVPAASPTSEEEGTDSLAVAREALEFAHSFGRNLRQVHKLLPLLAEVVGSLEEADHPKAQCLLDHLHFWLQRETSPAVAPKVAGHMLLLLDAAPEYLRAFGYTTFQTMLERGAERDVRHLALRSLVPVLLHLKDDSPTVVEASWNILKRLATLVGLRKLEPLLWDWDKSSVCLVMAKQFRKVPACHFLLQTVRHLNSPHASTREAAVRMLGFIGMQTQDQRKLAVIHKALREVTSGQHLSVHSPALRTIDLLEALHEHVPARRNLREGLRWLFGPCCSSTEGV